MARKPRSARSQSMAMAYNPLTLLVLLLCLGLTIVRLIAVNLQIELDRTAESQGFYICTGVLEFKSDTAMFSDEELFDLARQAHTQMQRFFRKQVRDLVTGQLTVTNENGLRRAQQPDVMSALAVGKTIYFASNMKECQFFLYQEASRDENNAIYQALLKCETLSRGGKHQRGAACAEVWSMYLFSKDTDENKPAPETAKRVAVWGPYKDYDDPVSVKVVQPMPPCGKLGDRSKNLDNWGCSQFLDQLDVTSLWKRGIQPKDPGNDIAIWSGATSRHIPVC